MSIAAAPLELASPGPAPASESAAPAGRYFIQTYGCQMNDNDSEIMSGILEERGMVRAASQDEADVVLVNTCVVREGAEERAIGRLNSLLAQKRRNPAMVIGVAGCMSQKSSETVAARVPHADLIVGTRDLFKIGDLVEQVRRTGQRVIATADVDKPVFLDAQKVRRNGALKALTTIMYGCNNFCSFCIVPKTRGREVSRPPAEVLRELQGLAAQGYKEVQLLGQNVNSYYHEGTDFADLLTLLCRESGLERFRFMTSHPKDCSPKLIEAIAALPQMCTNFHLPVQSGSNRVLRRMKRFYTAESYLELCQRVRATVPGATISTDLICGYPDETDGDYEESYQLLEAARWDSAFIFMYSPREGTKSAQLLDSVPAELKQHRVARCIARQEQISGELNATYVGTRQEVLVESVSKRREHELMGRTRGDKCVIFEGRAELVGSTVYTHIHESHPHTLFGRLSA